MSHAFSLFVSTASGLHRLHPLTKLTLLLAVLVGSFALPSIWAGYAIYVLILLPLAGWGKILRRFGRASILAVFPFALSLFLIQGFLWPHGTPLFGIGVVTLKQEGLIYATATVGRIAVVISSFLLLSFSTRPDDLMLALTERGLPRNLAYIILTTIQIIPRFQAKAQQILDAQRARGLETEGGLIVRFRALFPLVAPLILGSILDVEERAIALEARAFSKPGPRTSLLVLHDTRPQIAVRWLLLVMALALLVWRIALGGAG